VQAKRSQGAMSVDDAEFDRGLLGGRVGAVEEGGFAERNAVEAPGVLKERRFAVGWIAGMAARGRLTGRSAVWPFYVQVAVAMRLPDAGRLLVPN
jgi:hypothetical protein